MKIQSLAVALIAFLSILAFQIVPAQADNDKLDFTLVNKTGYDIKAVYVGPTSSDDWGDTIIDKPLIDGAELAITFSPKAKAEKWDIRIEWVDGDKPVNWIGFKLSEITKITLHYNKDTGETTAATE